jgi:hypothetical protein
MSDQPPAGCGCAETDQRLPDIRVERAIGEDKTKGRYAEVELVRCTRCGTSWVKYFVEYEAFTGSGRWAMAPIGAAAAAAIRPEEVPAYLEAAPWFVFGGSYHGHGGKRGQGKLRWDL